MTYLSLQVVRFVDGSFPGFVEAVFTDAEGTQHTIEDKVSVIALSDLWSDSEYPQPGVAACEVLDRSQDPQNRSICRITIDRPWALESTTGQTEFVVLESQISEE